MAIAYQFGSGVVRDGGVYFLRPEGNPSGLVTSLTTRANVVNNVNSSNLGTALDAKFLSWENEDSINQIKLSNADNSVSAANGNATILLPAAGPGRNHIISGLAFSYSSTPAPNSFVQIEAPSGNVVFKQYITTAGTNMVLFNDRKIGADNTAILLTLSSGGANVTGSLSILGRRID